MKKLFVVLIALMVFYAPQAYASTAQDTYISLLKQVIVLLQQQVSVLVEQLKALQNNQMQISVSQTTSTNNYFSLPAASNQTNTVTNSTSATIQTETPFKIKSPAYLIGIGYSHFNEVLGRTDSIKEVADAANLIYISSPWRDSNFWNNVLSEDTKEAQKDGLSLYIAIEDFNPERTKIDLPAGLSGDFSQPDVRSEYLSFVEKVAATYKPEYMILNVEANQLKKYDVNAYESYLPVYAEAYDAVKKISPNTKVAASLVLTSADSNSCIKDSDMANLKRDLTDFPKSDIFAVSVYPMCFIQPESIPKDFITNIAKLSDKPLFISETGWLSEGLSSVGSESNQASFIKKLKEMADQAIRDGSKIEAINYVGLLDPSKEMCDSIVSYNPSLFWYCRLSLVRPDGINKPAYQEFVSWKDSLK